MNWSDVLALFNSARYVSTNFSTNDNNMHISVVTHDGDLVSLDITIAGGNYGSAKFD